MKIAYAFIIAIIFYIFYLYYYSGYFNMALYYLFDNKRNSVADFVLYQNVKKIEDINGDYSFSCKYSSFPYVLGIGFKYKHYKAWDSDNAIPKPEIIINPKSIKNISNLEKYVQGYGGDFGFYYAGLHLFKFSVDDCKDAQLSIEFVKSNMGAFPNNLLYLYIKPDIHL